MHMTNECTQQAAGLLQDLGMQRWTDLTKVPALKDLTFLF